MDIQQALIYATQALQSVSDIPKREARWLLAEALNVSDSYLIIHFDKILDCEQQQCFERWLKRRKEGEPLAHVLGYQYFWSLKLKVTPDTLIPRADTEVLVEAILSRCHHTQAAVLDLGTGSGAIALALAVEKPNWHISALDCSPAALAVACENAMDHAIHNVTFIHSDWFNQLESDVQFDLVVSNPPYIDANDPHLCPHVALYEPRSALIADHDGYADLVHIIRQSYHHLRKGGLLVIEHGFQQGELVRQYFANYGYECIEPLYDLSGHWRATLGYKLS